MVTATTAGRTVVKICGVRDERGAAAVGESGADLAGLLFVPGRRRAVTVEQAQHLLPRLGRVRPIGVFLDASVEAILEVSSALRLEMIQLHGEDPPEVAARLAARGLQVLRAVAASEHDDEPTRLRDRLLPYRDHVVGFLLDGPLPGSGHRSSIRLVERGGLTTLARALERPVWLAGGLDPDNVADAIERSGATGVDVASGIEVDGTQDPGRISAFVRAARGGQSL